MKLITEINQEIKPVILEEKIGENVPPKKNYFIEGVFLQCDIRNKNGRIYPSRIMDKEVARYTKDMIAEKRAFGELGHPSGPSINLDRVSHIITELRKDGNNYIGKAKILDTPFGKIVKNLIDEGARLGVSSRGLGSVEEENGTSIVQDDLNICTAADIVAEPSAPSAFVRGIMEGKEWVYVEDNKLVEKAIPEMKKTIEKTSIRNYDKEAMRLFEEYLRLASMKTYKTHY